MEIDCTKVRMLFVCVTHNASALQNTDSCLIKAKTRIQQDIFFPRNALNEI